MKGGHPLSRFFAHAETGHSNGGLSRLNRNVWPPNLVIIAVCNKRPGFAFRKNGQPTYDVYIYTYIVFHKYHYFLQETGRLSLLTNSINLYSLCCTFASSRHLVVRDSDFCGWWFNLLQTTCFKIFNYVAPVAHFKRVCHKHVT